MITDERLAFVMANGTAADREEIEEMATQLIRVHNHECLWCGAPVAEWWANRCHDCEDEYQGGIWL